MAMIQKDTIISHLLFERQRAQVLTLLEALYPLGKKMGAKYGAEGEYKIKLLERPDILAMVQVIERKDFKLFEQSEKEKPEYRFFASSVITSLVYNTGIDTSAYTEQKDAYNEIERILRTLPGTDLTALANTDIILEWVVNRKELHLFYVLILYYLFVYYEFKDSGIFKQEIDRALVAHQTFLDYFVRFNETELLELKDDKQNYINTYYSTIYKDCPGAFVDLRTDAWRDIIGLILSQIGAVN